MPGAARLGDTAGGHGCFPPTALTSASAGVMINGLPAARLSDAAAPHGCPCPKNATWLSWPPDCRGLNWGND